MYRQNFCDMYSDEDRFRNFFQNITTLWTYFRIFLFQDLGARFARIAVTLANRCHASTVAPVPKPTRRPLSSSAPASRVSPVQCASSRWTRVPRPLASTASASRKIDRTATIAFASQVNDSNRFGNWRHQLIKPNNNRFKKSMLEFECANISRGRWARLTVATINRDFSMHGYEPGKNCNCIENIWYGEKDPALMICMRPWSQWLSII